MSRQVAYTQKRAYMDQLGQQGHHFHMQEEKPTCVKSELKVLSWKPS